MDKDITGVCTGGNITVDGTLYAGPVLISSWLWDAPKITRDTTTQNRVIIQFKDDTRSTTLQSITASVSLKNEKLFPEAQNPGKCKKCPSITFISHNPVLNLDSYKTGVRTNIQLNVFPDSTLSLNASIGFSTDKDTRFSCTKVTTFEGGDGGDIILEQVQVEVGNNNDGTFSKVGNECNAGSISIAISLLSALLLSVIITMF